MTLLANPVSKDETVSKIAILVAPADGVPVLREVFRSLQGDFPGSILIQVQPGNGRERGIADNLNTASGFMVLPGVAGSRIRNGHAYVIPSGTPLAIDSDGVLRSNPGETLLTSLASLNGPSVIAVALTELDERDVAGFRLIRKSGGHTIALDESDRLWADSSGPRVVPVADDELLTTRAIGPRLLALTLPTVAA